jgi:5-methylcytosine-specific restriction endonuclease McrA
VAKICRRCLRVLDASEFRPNPKLTDGIDSWCKDCHRTAVRQSRAKHSDRYNRQRRRDVRSRRGVLQAIDGDPDRGLYVAAVALDPCAYCHGQSDQLDHVTSIKAGGTHTVENFAAACSTCNREKQTTSLLGFLLKRRIRQEIAALDAQRAACA